MAEIRLKPVAPNGFARGPSLERIARDYECHFNVVNHEAGEITFTPWLKLHR
jgi:hypothetical protein